MVCKRRILLYYTIILVIAVIITDASETVSTTITTKTLNESLNYGQRTINSAGLQGAPTNAVDDGVKVMMTHDSAYFLPNRSICGLLTDEERIFGGENAAIDEFPWLVRIKYLLDNGKEVYACAGSLITNNYVLTAAHCAVNLTIKEVKLGDWNIATEPDCQGRACSDPAIDIKVSQVTVYPHYSKSSTFKGDIALLKLQRPVKFSDFISPICLPTTEDIVEHDYSSDGVFWTAGWGKTEYDKKPQIKQKLALNAVPIDDCRNRQPIISDESAPFVICAGGEEGKDTCVGDSGGSLVKQITTSNSTNWFLVGVTSYGYKHCGSEGRPGLYARVTPHMSWILSNIVK